MVIKEFIIKELFGVYSYHIDFERVGSNVCIIHALNGRGKTTILNLIQAIIKTDVDYLDSVPFKSIRVRLDNGAVIDVVKSNAFVCMLNKTNEFYQNFAVTSSEQAPQEFYNWFGNMCFYINGVYTPMLLICTPYRVNEMGAILKASQIFDTRNLYNTILANLNRAWYWYIEANRLTKKYENAQDAYPEFGSEPVIKPTIEVCQEDILLKMNEAKSNYAMTSEKYDQNFPLQVMKKIIKADEKDILTKEEIEEQVAFLDDKRREYSEIGIISDPPSSSLEELASLLSSEMNRETRIFLTQYIRNSFKKFKSYESIAEKMRLLKEYINSHSEYADKEMEYDAKRGIVFKSRITGRDIPIEKLSSGELNNLILFYELIFVINKGWLVLIDEPEISLHVLWQRGVIDELLKICNRNGIQAIVATHSPDIADTHFKNLVSLKEDDDEDVYKEDGEYGEEDEEEEF